MSANFASLLYDPEVFVKVCQVLNSESQSYLQAAQSQVRPVTHHKTGPEMLAHVQSLMTQAPLALDPSSASEIPQRVQTLVREFLNFSTCLQSPNYMGHQVNPPIPFAAAMTAVGGMLNPGLAVYEMSPFASAVERALIAKLGPYLNWPEGKYDGVVTSGGSLANLTAILAARNWKYPNAWKKGMGDKKAAILTSADSHYSVMRAAGALGIGADQIIKIPLDSKRRMDASKLSEIFKQAVVDGFEPFCLVGSACSTPIGAFDPLEDLASFAKAQALWFHVDAAHGGPFLLSKRHRHLLKGIEHADSVIWDAHKMMFVPSLCTFVLYRNPAHSYLPFQQDAPYLFAASGKKHLDINQDPRSYDGGLRTFECTKGPIAVPIWTLWSIFGDAVFSELADRMIENTVLFFNIIKDSKDFVAVHEPQCNILCFRYIPSGDKDATTSPAISDLQVQIRSGLVEDGKFYITGTNIDGIYALRVTMMNPFTEQTHILALLEKIRELAANKE
jgi:L-2,4-diaminobutyrate decarboxylase